MTNIQIVLCYVRTKCRSKAMASNIQGRINFHLTGGVQISLGKEGGALVRYQGADQTSFIFYHRCRYHSNYSATHDISFK